MQMSGRNCSHSPCRCEVFVKGGRGFLCVSVLYVASSFLELKNCISYWCNTALWHSNCSTQQYTGGHLALSRGRSGSAIHQGESSILSPKSPDSPHRTRGLDFTLFKLHIWCFEILWCQIKLGLVARQKAWNKILPVLSPQYSGICR